MGERAKNGKMGAAEAAGAVTGFIWGAIWFVIMTVFPFWLAWFLFFK